jgi:hypothetical protein
MATAAGVAVPDSDPVAVTEGTVTVAAAAAGVATTPVMPPSKAAMAEFGVVDGDVHDVVTSGVVPSTCTL